MTEGLLSVHNLEVHFPVRTGGVLRARYRALKAVDGVTFDLASGETLGVVGESGCGKSTLARAILRLIQPTGGKVVWMGENLATVDEGELRLWRREAQIIFQDPLASLDPRMTVGRIIGEPLEYLRPELSKEERQRRVEQTMAKVGLLPQMIHRYPHEFSGGQCQRIGIARAVILEPKMVICDEPVSALDVSIQAQIINLLMDLQRELGLALLFISHDLSVVRHISRRVMVLYLGKVMEVADRDAIFDRPLHPYTQALISAVPVPDPGVEATRVRQELGSELPSPIDPPSGCVFRTRCPLATERCAAEAPVLENVDDSHEIACHHWREGIVE